MLNSLKGPGRSRAPATANHAAPLDHLVHPHQRVAEPLPDPLSDDVSSSIASSPE